MRNCASKSSSALSWNLSTHQLHPQSPGSCLSWAQLLAVCLGRFPQWHLRGAEQGYHKKHQKALSASGTLMKHGHSNLAVAASASHFIMTGVIYFWILKVFQYIRFQILPLNPQVPKKPTHGRAQRVRASSKDKARAPGQRSPASPEVCCWRSAHRNLHQKFSQSILQPVPAVHRDGVRQRAVSTIWQRKEALLGLETFPFCLWSSLVPRIISRASSI